MNDNQEPGVEVRFHIVEMPSSSGYARMEPTGSATVSSWADLGYLVGDRMSVSLLTGRGAGRTTASVVAVRPPGENKSGRFEFDVNDFRTEATADV